jgi:hypothetical protein
MLGRGGRRARGQTDTAGFCIPGGSRTGQQPATGRPAWRPACASLLPEGCPAVRAQPPLQPAGTSKPFRTAVRRLFGLTVAWSHQKVQTGALRTRLLSPRRSPLGCSAVRCGLSHVRRRICALVPGRPTTDGGSPGDPGEYQFGDRLSCPCGGVNAGRTCASYDLSDLAVYQCAG